VQLKDYQTDVLSDLSAYLQTLLDCKGNLRNAFAEYWKSRGVLGQIYKNNILEVPHVCVKVPTAGGKTFIAVNALPRIFAAFAEFHSNRPRFVVWLVPSLTILEQTVTSLCNIDHPYRQKLNDLFQGRVQIYKKNDVLQGASFSPDTVREQLSIVVISFDSLKATNKENRKAYQENGYLASFSNQNESDTELLSAYDRSSLINVIRALKPLVVVDESHNAESALSVEMLRNLNPSFILDLTATPRENSNIISYVDALRLKTENMVKLPVIVANQRTKEDVIMSALNMRRQLEVMADKAFIEGSEYIRPIVLFQAEPKSRDDRTTFEKLKAVLINQNIPPSHIAIKTANLNELRDVDLTSQDCEIRYIITVNALKEGWDCPFAYVLATVANKSSVLDVTQILGRILRMPQQRKQKSALLNLSYVFTASPEFQLTLAQIVEGLNKAGFSQRDYREVELEDISSIHTLGQQELLAGIDGQEPDAPSAALAIDIEVLNPNWEAEALHAAETPQSHHDSDARLLHDHLGIEVIKAQAIAQAQSYEEQASKATLSACPLELKDAMNEQKMKSIFQKSTQHILLPQFFIKVQCEGGFFESDTEWHKVAKENLLSDFVLANLDATLNFNALEAEIFAVDAEEVGDGESAPSFKAIQWEENKALTRIINSQSSEGQIKSIVHRLFSFIGKNAFYPIEDNDIKKYLSRIVDSMSAAQRSDCITRDYAYVKPIKDKIQGLANAYAAREFDTWLSTQKVVVRESFALPPSIAPSEDGPAISKSLYIREGGMNGLESLVIGKVAQLSNVLWWHRNLDRGRGFCINGFINHYPDFIALTEKKSLVIIETKGDDRDNSDSKDKMKIGKEWAAQANQISSQTGFRYHYLMVFQSNPVTDALTLSDALGLIANL
jgi:type III restriction enzyme